MHGGQLDGGSKSVWVGSDKIGVGHRFQLETIRLNAIGEDFTQRVVRHWSKLLREVMASLFVEVSTFFSKQVTDDLVWCWQRWRLV